MIARVKAWFLAMGALCALIVFAIIGWARAVAAGKAEKAAERRVDAIKEAQDVQNEVEALDRDTLRRRASVWVRKADKR